MSLIIQVTTIDGRVLEALRRSVAPAVPFQEGHTIQMSFPTKDRGLAAYVSKVRQSDCSVEKEPKSDKYSVIVSLTIRQIRHLVDTENDTVESLAVLVPTSRTGEAVVTYVADPALCDPRVLHMIRGQARA